MKNKLITSTLAGSALLLSLAYGHANAFLISTTGGSAGNPSGSLYKVTVSAADVGDSFSVNWLVPSGTGGLPVNLAASSLWTINSYAANGIEIGISITNDTNLGAHSGRADITAFGFGTVPDSTASFATNGKGSAFVGIGSPGGQNFPGGFSATDICVWAGPNCQGGGGSGLGPGETDSIVLKAIPRSSVYGDSIDLLFFPIKFQTAWGSFEPAGVPTSGPSIQQIPEPGILTLIGIGLFGLGVLRKRRI